jgi:hypothetical protein
MHYEYDYYFTDCYDGGGDYGDGGYGGENYGGNEDYGGGSGGEDFPPNNDSIIVQEKICDAYHGTIDVASLSASSNNFTPQQEQFIISLANLAALYELGYSSENLKTDLINYSTSNSLYTKYNKLLHPERYITNWTSAGNSSPNSNTAYVSPEIGDSGFQLKYYPEKNGEYNALGLVKEGNIEHAREWALEFLERIDIENFGFHDDYLYDMHLFNALDFMDYYCND